MTASDLGDLDDNRHFNVLFQWPIAGPRRKPAIPSPEAKIFLAMLTRAADDGSGWRSGRADE
jgi:hypothetical protein